jgi:hypothetical protein
VCGRMGLGPSAARRVVVMGVSSAYPAFRKRC